MYRRAIYSLIRLVATLMSMFILFYLIFADKYRENRTNQVPRHEVITIATDSLNFIKKDKIVVAISQNIGGLIVADTSSYGFWREVLTHFATKEMGVDVEFEILPTSREVVRSLALLNSDMAVVMENSIGLHNINIEQLPLSFSEQFVIVERDYLPKFNQTFSLTNKVNAPLLDGKSIILTQPFTYSQSYDHWLDNISSVVDISHNPLSQLVDSMKESEVDYIICSKIQAQIATTINKKTKIGYQFEDHEKSLLTAHRRERYLISRFNRWIEQFQNSKTFKDIELKYSADNSAKTILAQMGVRTRGSISQFDSIIKELSSQYGFDWRYVSAIAFCESNFNDQSQSRVGAVGLMQVMPHVAEGFGVSELELTDAATNIEVALKLLSQYERNLLFSSQIAPQDAMAIILASYNAGLGHILDARRLSIEAGKDPDRWENVAFFLAEKINPEVYNKPIVKSGKFRGKETIAFVNKVIKTYNDYMLRTTK